MTAAGSFTRFTWIIAIVLVAPLPLSPAKITVGGACSLQDAIRAANADTAVGGCAPGSGTDVVELTGDIQLTAADNGDNGLPQISSSLKVEGNGFTVARNPAAPDFRLFEVLTNGTLRIDDAVLSSGSVVNVNGGAILNRGTLRIENTRVSESYALNGGAISSSASGSTTIIDSALTDNYAVGYGGGLYSSLFATTVVTGSTISDNYAGWAGGGVFAYGSATISGSTISRNNGGIYLVYDASTVTDSLIADNSFAGVFSRNSAELTLVNSTISGNSGSGVSMYQSFGDGFTELINTSVVGNSPYGVELGSPYDVMILTNTVLAYNVASCGGSVPADGGGNFDDDGSCPGANLITGLDPTPADNGGPTYTHALLPGSSAINAGGDCGLPDDQRGFGRDALCDSGAFEFDGAPAVGAATDGLRPQLGSCSNLTTGETVDFFGQASWNCRASGLTINSGDRVSQDVRGRPTQLAFGGSVEGVDGTSVACRNLTTGQVVQFSLSDQTSWDCEEQGLMFTATDRVAWQVFGDAL